MQMILLIAGAAALSLSPARRPTTAAPEFDYQTGEAVDDSYEQRLEAHVYDEFKDANPRDLPDPDECTGDMVEMCKGLWEKRLAVCKANEDKWAGMCEPPRYTDEAGRTHNCMKGQCSPIYKDVYEHKMEVKEQCHQFDGHPIQQVSCHVCEESFPEHVLPCMSCGEHCMERHCDDPNSHECLSNKEMRSCLNACVHESLEEVCSRYEGALEVSCHMCEQFYPRSAVECMACSTECSQSHCAEPDSDECLFSTEVGKCHKKCMTEYKEDPEKEDQLCHTFEDAVEQESCVICEEKFPRHVFECMDCETGCLEKHCSGSEDMDDCAHLSVTRGCHKTCMGKHTNEICKHFKENPAAMEGCGACANKYNNRVLECMECGSDCLKETCADGEMHECMETDAYEQCHTPCMKSGMEETLEKLKNQLVQRQQTVWRRLSRRARHTRGR